MKVLKIVFAILLIFICDNQCFADTTTVKYSLLGMSFEIPTYYYEDLSYRNDRKSLFKDEYGNTSLTIYEDSYSKLDARLFNAVSRLDIWFKCSIDYQYTVEEDDIVKNYYDGLTSIETVRKQTLAGVDYYDILVTVLRPCDGATINFKLTQRYDKVNMYHVLDFRDMIRSIEFENTEEEYHMDDKNLYNTLYSYVFMTQEKDRLKNFTLPSFFDKDMKKIKKLIKSLDLNK